MRQETRRIPQPIVELEKQELLFSNADILAEKTEIDVSLVRRIIAKHDNPEEINNDPANAPSKRLETLRNGTERLPWEKWFLKLWESI